MSLLKAGKNSDPISKRAKLKTCCIVGMDNQRLPLNMEKYNEKVDNLQYIISDQINKAVQKGYNTFIVYLLGCIDLHAALHVLLFKNLYKNIKLVLCESNSDSWKKTEYEQSMYSSAVAQSDSHIIFEAEYQHLENVIHYSSRLITFFHEHTDAGTTEKLFALAKRLNHEIVWIDTYTFEIQYLHYK